MAGLEGKEQSLERAFLKSESELGSHRGGGALSPRTAWSTQRSPQKEGECGRMGVGAASASQLQREAGM